MESPAAERDLGRGVAEDELVDGRPVRGRIGDATAMLVRVGDELFAVADRCTHYGGSLSSGLVVGDTVRCPLHHACFSLRTGQALSGPAYQPVACWNVRRDNGMVFAGDPIAPAAQPLRAAADGPSSIVIIGGGCAGFAAAQMVRREGYEGPVTIVGAEASAPYDRPNVSKDYLTGEARDEWMPLESPDFYSERRVTPRLGVPATAIDTAGRVVRVGDGEAIPFGALLIATGADAVHPPIPGADQPHVHYLRTDRDARAIIKDAAPGARAVVIGASFIGLEAAASLRARGVEVDIVAPESVPLERILGHDIGAFIQATHQAHGVRFHLGQSVSGIGERAVTLGSGVTLAADFVVIGVGVRPATALAERAGLTVERGIVVDEFLQTSEPGIFAAGDVARYTDPLSGGSVRVEHWVVASRQGQTAARNMLGRGEPYAAVPFFWAQQYDVTVKYVGHAERWDEARTSGSLEAGAPDGFSVTFLHEGRTLAVATVGRDMESLIAEAELEAAIRALGRADVSGLDQTIADSFPASDPPSTLPNPTDEHTIE